MQSLHTPSANPPLRRVDSLLAHYGESHRNPTNELIHFAAIPLIMWGGAGGESRKTIGVVIFFGAIFSTVLTLFIVPVFYNMLARFTKSPQATARRIEAFEEAEQTRAANAAE